MEENEESGRERQRERSVRKQSVKGRREKVVGGNTRENMKKSLEGKGHKKRG